MISLPVIQPSPDAPAPAQPQRELPPGPSTELAVDGMSCAACAARVERSLARLPGVQAQVNLATERAIVQYDPDTTTVQQLIDAIGQAGYEAAELGAGDEDAATDAAERERRALRSRAVGSALLSLPVIAITMVPAL
ncbi:MAG: cation transporter, partial [Patulibacter sp.]